MSDQGTTEPTTEDEAEIAEAGADEELPETVPDAYEQAADQD